MKRNVEIVHYPSLIPYIIAGAVYVVGSFLLPMYKLYSYVILIVLALGTYFIIKKANIFKDQEVEIEKPVVYETTELQDICQLGYEQIETLEKLITLVDSQTLIENTRGIIETSQAILKLIEDNAQLAKKVRKYFHYYVAEIIQLIKKYDEFEEDPLNIENVQNSKERIEQTVTNANQSFLKFYNDLYEGKSMDVNVDSKVLDSMLKKLD